MTQTAVTGLTSAEVAARVADGKVNDYEEPAGRSFSSIARANILTPFNFLIGGLWIVMLLIAPFQDGLFGFVIVINTLIGIVQEYRAARTLEHLSILSEVKPMVRRDGTDVAIRREQVVLDDVLVLATGAQLVVDAQALECDGLEIDESLLTGEADPVRKEPGDRLLSGSFVVAGSGFAQVTHLGADAFASGITSQAREFSVTRSELRDSLQRFITTVSWLILPIGCLLLWSQVLTGSGWRDALRGTIAGVVTMVPEGLMLLTSIAMAVSVVRLARKRTLVQDLPAVEVLARVDTVCVDKTGTLTEPGLRVRDVISLDDSQPIPLVLGALAGTETHPNPTMAAVRAQFPPDRDWVRTGGVPFSSQRKWSSATFGDRGSWVLGAPDVLTNDPHVTHIVSTHSADGARVLLLARATPEAAPPEADRGVGEVEPVALVVIDQMLRPDVAATMTYFASQGVDVKVISGDNAETVGVLARRAGIVGADRVMDARGLPEDIETPEFADAVNATTVFGRVTPLQKQAMVRALQSRGHVVAMTGDGVNDVLALKQADLGIAMGSGADATRAVAQIVLLSDSFDVMPSVVAEGRRVLGNIERVSDLYLTKSFYAMALSIATALVRLPFPFLPRHLSVITALSIGIPSFFLALMPNTQRFRPGFFRRVLIFTIPAGLVTAIAVFVAYYAVLNTGHTVAESRVAAAITLFSTAIAVLVVASRPLNALRLAIMALMIAGFLVVLGWPWLSNFFALSWKPDSGGLVGLFVGLAGAAAIIVVAKVTDQWRRPSAVDRDGMGDDGPVMPTGTAGVGA